MPNIYLSPSPQPYSEYVNGGNERYHMNILVGNMELYLRANGIRFIRNTVGMTPGQTIHEFSTGYYDLHLALHSSAAPSQLPGQLRGTDVYYCPYSTAGNRAAGIIARNYKEIYPLSDKARMMPIITLAKIIKTNTPAVLIETAYHDNPESIKWLVTHMPRTAANPVKSLTEIFRIPFIDNPQPARTAKIVTQGGNLDIRNRPSLDAAMISQAPNGATITILGEWQEWYVVNYDGIIGYFGSQFIR